MFATSPADAENIPPPILGQEATGGWKMADDYDPFRHLATSRHRVIHQWRRSAISLRERYKQILLQQDQIRCGSGVDQVPVRGKLRTKLKLLV